MNSTPQKALALTINGLPIRVEPGTTVLEAARRSEIYIPTLCHHPQLRPEGACRLCLVEVEGVRGLSPACTLPAADGMVVRTDTPELRELRREIFSLTLSEHPYSCLVCDRHARCGEWQTTIRKAGVTTGCENCPKNGQCELQVLVEKVGLSAMPYPIAYRGLPVERDDPFFDRDYNLCVLCGRCVRVCQEVRHTNTLGFLLRSSQTRVGAVPGSSHRELDCEFCGACVDVCPTGALFDKRTKWEGAPGATAKTVCPYCAVGCELDLWIKGGKVIGVRPNPEGKANRGQACVRGRFGLVELVHAENRLATPLLRREGTLVEAGWEEALSRAAERLSPLRGDSFALLGSPHLSTESAYVLGRFAREVMRSRNVDCAAALPRHAQVGELRDALLASPRTSIQSIRDAKCILVVGSNPRLSHPVVAMYIRQALRTGGAKLIVVDPRETELARRAHVWLRPSPGADAKILEALAGRRKSNPDDIQKAIRLLEGNSPAVILYGSGVTGYPRAAESIHAIRHLAESLKPPAGILPLVGASNMLGVLQTGLIAGEEDRNYEEIACGISAGEIRVLYVAGEVPPLPSLAKLDLLIVQDHVLSAHLETRAEIVLPAATFAETAGTMTNLEGRDQTFQAAIPPFGQSRPDWQIISALAQKMDAKEFAYRNAAEIRQEFSAVRKKNDEPEKKKVLARKTAARRKPAASFSLLTERNAFSYRGFSLTKGVQGMAEVKRDENALVLHPQDADSLGIREGDLVRIESPHGTDTRTACLDETVFPGTVFASINTLEGSPIFPGWLPTEKCTGVKLAKVIDPTGRTEGTT